MPFESSTPIVLAALVVAGISVYAWLKTQARTWAALGILAAFAALGLCLADRLVETDREYIEALFPRLAAAAERQDVTPIVAVLDPDLRPLRADVERTIEEVRPTEVRITRLDILVEPKASPPSATVSLIVRVVGRGLVAGGPGPAIVALKISMLKKNGEWRVQDAEMEPVKPGRSSDSRRHCGAVASDSLPFECSVCAACR